MDIQIKKPFGIMPDGTPIHSYTLSNGNGMTFSAINYGATIMALNVPLKNGETTDVVLGFDSIENYLESINLPAPPHFGAAVGRWAGRINNGIFTLNGKSYQLNKNNGGHSLHGGRFGFSQIVWDVKQINSEDNPSITFSYFSRDGDENFPGDLSVEVTYTLSEENELIVDFWAESAEDTIINLTQHSYFNLNGHQSDIDDQQLFINANKKLETRGMIPTGTLLNVGNTEFNFTTPQKCPHNIDATFVINKSKQPDAWLLSKKNHLKMTVSTTQPAVHIYVGGDLFGILKGKDGAAYHPLSGICFETQNFPDAPNHPDFPNPVLRKGETYKHRTTYQFHNDEGTD